MMKQRLLSLGVIKYPYYLNWSQNRSILEKLNSPKITIDRFCDQMKPRKPMQTSITMRVPRASQRAVLHVRAKTIEAMSKCFLLHLAGLEPRKMHTKNGQHDQEMAKLSKNVCLNFLKTANRHSVFAVHA